MLIDGLGPWLAHWRARSACSGKVWLSRASEHAPGAAAPVPCTEAYRRAAGWGPGDRLPRMMITVRNDCWQPGNDEGLGGEPAGTDRDQPAEVRGEACAGPGSWRTAVRRDHRLPGVAARIAAGPRRARIVRIRRQRPSGRPGSAGARCDCPCSDPRRGVAAAGAGARRSVGGGAYDSPPEPLDSAILFAPEPLLMFAGGRLFPGPR